VQFLSPNYLSEGGIFPRYRKRRFKSPRLIKIRLCALGSSTQSLYLNLEEVPTSITISTEVTDGTLGDLVNNNLSSQTWCVLPQCGHLIIGSLNLGGTRSLAPQSHVMVL